MTSSFPESFTVAELSELVELALSRRLIDPDEVRIVLEAELRRRDHTPNVLEHERFELMRLLARLHRRLGGCPTLRAERAEEF